jgi:hypothetical protein
VIGNGAPAFHVVYFEAVRANLKILAKRAKAAGRHGFFVDVLKAFDHRLRSDPRSVGEILYTLKKASLEVRLGGEHFLFLRFGVHIKERLVFVIDCHVLGDPGF